MGSVLDCVSHQTKNIVLQNFDKTLLQQDFTYRSFSFLVSDVRAVWRKFWETANENSDMIENQKNWK